MHIYTQTVTSIHSSSPETSKQMHTHAHTLNGTSPRGKDGTNGERGVEGYSESLIVDVSARDDVESGKM